MTLPARRKLELDRKVQNLKAELKDWTARTNIPPMRRHHSQVRRLVHVLDGLLESMLSDKAWKNPNDDTILTNVADWEKRILAAHAIWEVFRSKLALRQEDFFRDALTACDDLAWACYQPALAHFSNAPKEPPLVYLNSTWSPFFRARDKDFEKEIVAGMDAGGAIEEEDYLKTIRKLPIPLLGLPWFQVGHLPSALLIAHEVGHAVEFDFQLTTKITGALSNADLAFKQDWLDCASEVFADLYGCLCLGPYFASALLDLLVGNKDVVKNEQDFSKYPTRIFRVKLAVSALEYLDYKPEAAAILSTWQSVYGKPVYLEDHNDDVKKVVDAIYGQAGLDLTAVIKPPARVVLAPNRGIKEIAEYAARNLVKDRLDQVTDARVLFCAARYVYDNMPADLERATPLIVNQVVRGYASQFRYRGALQNTQQDLDSQLDDVKAADAEIGRDIGKELGL